MLLVLCHLKQKVTLRLEDWKIGTVVSLLGTGEKSDIWQERKHVVALDVLE